MRIGFLGLGAMGGLQAGCIARSFPDLAVYDVSRAAMEKFEGKARLAGSPADAGREREVVHVCVRDDQQVRSVVDGEDGLIASMAPGSVILIHSTIGPQTIVELAGKAAGRGITLIDAPVTRTAYIEDGPFVFCMTGGDEAVTERVMPILETFSTDIVHVGRLGSASMLKICNNLVSLTQILIANQAFDLAAAGGVPAEKLIRVMKRNGALTPSMENNINYPRRFQGSAEELQAAVESQAGNVVKDFELAALAAAGAGAFVPTAEHAREVYRQVVLGALSRPQL